MTDQRKPIAWLPADNFERKDEQGYIAIFTDLIATGESFKVDFLVEKGANYELVVEARITRPNGKLGAAEIELTAGESFRENASEDALISRSYKPLDPNSTRWKRFMDGTPAPHMVANHMFSGIKHLVGFDTSRKFGIKAKTHQAESLLNSIVRKHYVSAKDGWTGVIYR
jgi:hypothetical protein